MCGRHMELIFPPHNQCPCRGLLLESLHSRVTGACPVTTDLIMPGNVRTTTTTTTTERRALWRKLQDRDNTLARGKIQQGDLAVQCQPQRTRAKHMQSSTPVSRLFTIFKQKRRESIVRKEGIKKKERDWEETIYVLIHWTYI